MLAANSYPEDISWRKIYSFLENGIKGSKKDRALLAQKYEFTILTSINTKTPMERRSVVIGESSTETAEKARNFVNVIFNKTDIPPSLFDLARGGLAVASEEVPSENGITKQRLDEIEKSPELPQIKREIYQELIADPGFKNRTPKEQIQIYSDKIKLKFLRQDKQFKLELSKKVHKTALFILAIKAQKFAEPPKKGRAGRIPEDIPPSNIKLVIVPESLRKSFAKEKEYFKDKTPPIIFVPDMTTTFFYAYGFPATYVQVDNLVIPDYQSFLESTYKASLNRLGEGEVLATHMTRL